MSDKYTYRITWSEDDQEYIGLCAEFPSLSWLSKTQEAALKGIRNLVKECIADMEEQGEVPPEPILARQFSGKFVVRVPPETHRLLVLFAMEAGVSLNRYVNAKLSLLNYRRD